MSLETRQKSIADQHVRLIDAIDWNNKKKIKNDFAILSVMRELLEKELIEILERNGMTEDDIRTKLDEKAGVARFAVEMHQRFLLTYPPSSSPGAINE